MSEPKFSKGGYIPSVGEVQIRLHPDDCLFALEDVRAGLVRCGRPDHHPTAGPVEEWRLCPDCRVERADWEHDDGGYLPKCPNCGSDAAPTGPDPRTDAAVGR